MYYMTVLKYCYFPDLFLVVDYFTHGHLYWAVSTFLLIVLPATVVQMFSMRWHIMDDSTSYYHWLAHVFLLGLIHRYASINIFLVGYQMCKVQ